MKKQALRLVRVLSISLALTFVAAPNLAFAETDLKAAKESFQKGRDAYQDDDFGEAAKYFVEAYGFSGRSELLFNIGQAYRMADDLTEAEKYFQQYLSEMPDAKNADEVVNMVIEIQQEIAARMATVQVSTTTPGRTVTVKDSPDARCTTPCTLNLSPGDHTLVFSGEGAKEKSKKITLTKAQKLDVTETLEVDRVPGRIVLMTDRDGRVQVGTDVDQAIADGQSTVEVLDGTYPMVVSSGRAKVETEIVVSGGQSVTMIVPLEDLHNAEKASGWMRITSYSLGAASLGLGVGALLAGLQAQSTFDELDRQQASRGFVDAGLLNAGQSEQSVTNVLLFSAVGAFAVGAALFIVDEFVLDGGSEASASTAIPEAAPASPASEPTPEAEEPPVEEEEIELL